MTALKRTPLANAPGIEHPCLRRKSHRTYELLNPKKAGEDVLSFDIGQVRAIVDMDRQLREDGVVGSVPAGYSVFADRFNECATGPERFATFSYEVASGMLVISKPGKPIVWDHFLIDDAMDIQNSDLPLGASASQLPSNDPDAKSLVSDSAAMATESRQLEALSAHLKTSMATTDQLVTFWMKRGAIESDYASRLARLSETTIGGQETSQFRDAINAFRVEAARQAMIHNTLSTQIAMELEARCLKLQLNQSSYWLRVHEPMMRKFEEPLPTTERSPHTGVSYEWRKEYRRIRHSLDITRLRAMRGSHSPFHLQSDLALDELKVAWGSSRKMDWDSLRRSCHKMETDRVQVMEELLSAFTDILCSIRDSHNESRRTIIRAVDLFRPDEVIEEFCNNFMNDDDVDLDKTLDDDDIQALRSPARPLPQPAVSDAKSQPNGRIRNTEHRTAGKHFFYSPSGARFLVRERVPASRPPPATSNGSFLRSRSLPSHLRPAQQFGESSGPSLSSRNRLPGQSQRDLRRALPKISTNIEPVFRKEFH